MIVFRRSARTLVLLAVVALALMLAALGRHDRASAHVPHPGLDFSMSVDATGDTVPDCGTGIGQPAKCTAPTDWPLHVKVYLNSLGGLPDYAGFDIELNYTGVNSKDNPDSSVWPDCAIQAQKVSNPGYIAWGCARGVPPAPDSTYIGLIGTVDFNCTNDGTLTLFHNTPALGTDLVTSTGTSFEEHAEGQGVGETLTVNCAAPVGGVASDVQLGGSASYVWGVYTLSGLVVIGLAALGWTLRRHRAR